MAHKVIKPEVRQNEDEFAVVVPEEHVDESVAEAIDTLAHRIVKAQHDYIPKLIEAIRKLEPKIEKKINTPIKYKLSVTKYTPEGRISEIQTEVIS